ncbi:MAG: Bifunctional NAD(P)H-hydrate repair enzyme Nnr [Phycisphaerae bacterium]|nr:Bifunctional NAD(P)H-hydrate repair enzyme Nnr [Phycisphaerae bacterium]
MPISLQDIYLTVAQTRRIDALAVERYRMPSIVLMENAARSALAAVTTFYPPENFRRVAALVGAGNNGGDGLAVARLLHNAGYLVRVVYAADPDKLDGDAGVNRDIVQAMHLPDELLRSGDELNLERAEAVFGDSDLAVDGLLGTGIKGAARPPLRDLIELLNNQPALPVVALDVPSGFDADAGMPADQGEGSAVIAETTVTFAANKAGYREPGADAYTGRVIVGSIGVPVELLEEVRGTLRP